MESVIGGVKGTQYGKGTDLGREGRVTERRHGRNQTGVWEGFGVGLTTVQEGER